MIEFRPWSKQAQAFMSTARVTIFGAGIQSGKTTVGVNWLQDRILEASPGDNFIVTSPTFRILEQSTLPPFLRLMDGLGTFHRSGMYFRTYDDMYVWFRTNTDPDSVVGITNVKAILCDEAGLYTRYFWDNIMARAAFKRAPIMLVTSPYSQNWLYLDYVRHMEKKPDAVPDTLLIQARSDENPHFPKDEYERQKKLMDPRRFDMVFGGRFGAMEGLVYDCWDEAENVCPPPSIPAGTEIVAGVDWGYGHAFVIHVRALMPDGDHIQIAELFKPGLNPVDMVNAAEKLKLTWGIKIFYCDPSQPGMIDLFNSRKLVAVGANNDIPLGIGYHYELVKTRRFKVIEGRCPYSVDQYATYHYPSPKDLKPDQDAKDIRPVKVNDDTCDAARYCTAMTYHRSEGKRRTLDSSQAKDINRLSHDQIIEIRKRPKRYVDERWS